MVFLHVNCCILKEEQGPYVFWVCFSPHNSKGEMCRHHIAWTCGIHGCSRHQGGAAWQLPSSLTPEPWIFLWSLSAALEDSLASDELSKLCMTAPSHKAAACSHSPQRLAPDPKFQEHSNPVVFTWRGLGAQGQGFSQALLCLFTTMGSERGGMGFA